MNKVRVSLESNLTDGGGVCALISSKVKVTAVNTIPTSVVSSESTKILILADLNAALPGNQCDIQNKLFNIYKDSFNRLVEVCKNSKLLRRVAKRLYIESQVLSNSQT